MFLLKCILKGAHSGIAWAGVNDTVREQTYLLYTLT